MIFSPEQAGLKAQHQCDALRDFGDQAARDSQRIDAVERELFRRLLGLGHPRLSAFVTQQGDGDVGPKAETAEGQIARRWPERHDRRYVAIFGELTIPRAVYGSREGQKIERVPLDERLGLPEGDFSSLLEDWSQRLGLKASFAEAGQSLEMLLGLRLGTRALEGMNRAVAAYAPAFQASWEVPRPDEDGPLLVVTADGQGGPMRRPPEDGPRPHRRRTKGQQAHKKPMACVGAVDSIEPFVRTAEDLIDEVLPDQRAEPRPRPQHKPVGAEMTRQIDGIAIPAKEGLFCRLSTALLLRNLGQDRPVICLRDGERALWEAQKVSFPEAVGILDRFHVLERLGAVAHCFPKEGSDGAKQFGDHRLRDWLQGRVSYVISGRKHRLRTEKLSGPRRQVVRSAGEYLANNRDHLRYDAYLAAGDPIGSGVAEGACRPLVKDRLEQTGMRWTVEGTQAMLHVRALYLNDQWEEFLVFRVDQEQAQLDKQDAA